MTLFDPFGPVRSDLENPLFDAYVEYRFSTIRFRTCRFWTRNDLFLTLQNCPIPISSEQVRPSTLDRDT